MGQPFIGEIRAVSFDFAPRNWATCSGQMLPVSQHQALYSLLSTQYGGDGVNDFGLPNLNGRCAVHKGQGPGLTTRIQGQIGGQESVTLTTDNLASHNHAFHAYSGETADNIKTPGGASYAQASREKIYKKEEDPNVAMNPAAITNTGAGQPHNNMMPFLVVNYVIALQGDYPSRS